jgi:hypothetical protein
LSSTIRRRALISLIAVVGVVLVIVSDPRNSDSRCVGGRVPIETLSDGDNVVFAPVPAGIESLQRLHRPARLHGSSRSRPVEATTYRIKVKLVSMRRRSNDAIDLLVSDPARPSRTMIVGFEGSRTCGHRAVVRAQAPMRKAERALVAACGEPRREYSRLSGTAEISGVGYFGHLGRVGVPPNGIGLHPALRFKSADCRRLRGSAIRRAAAGTARTRSPRPAR